MAVPHLTARHKQLEVRPLIASKAHRRIGLLWRTSFPQAEDLEEFGRLILGQLPDCVEVIGTPCGPAPTPRRPVRSLPGGRGPAPKQQADTGPHSTVRPPRTAAVALIFARFLAVYALLYAAFGVQSPFLPALLAERGLRPDEIGVVLAASTAVRVLAGPALAHAADRWRRHGLSLCTCATAAAMAGVGYLTMSGFRGLLTVALVHAVALAPIVPVSDALATTAARQSEVTRGRLSTVGCEPVALPHSSPAPSSPDGWQVGEAWRALSRSVACSCSLAAAQDCCFQALAKSSPSVRASAHPPCAIARCCCELRHSGVPSASQLWSREAML